MKRLTLFFIAGLTMVATSSAQQTGSTPPMASPSSFASGSPSVVAGQITISPDEWQELRTARSAALQANPDLIAENKKLMERMRTLENKVDAAMIKADPSLAPIIAKFEANRPHPGTPAPSTTNSPPTASPPPK